MLTLDAIIATTRQQAAFGEGTPPGVPRDRAARPRSAPAREEGGADVESAATTDAADAPSGEPAA